MEITREYADPLELQKCVRSIFRSQFICTVQLTLEEIHSAVEFFIANWSALKTHDPAVIVGSSVLVGIYRSGCVNIKRKFGIIKKFTTSVMAMKSCIYDVLRSRGIPMTYEFGELPVLLKKHWERLVGC